MRSERFASAAKILEAGVRDQAFPAAVAEVGRHDGVIWRYALGRLSYDPEADAAGVDTIFDLASLTKVISTTTIALRLVETGQLHLVAPVSTFIVDWTGRDRTHVTMRHLLEHASGLTAWLPLFRDLTGRREFEHTIASLPLEYEPGTKSIYSDLGFILLGFIIADAARKSLSEAFGEIAQQFFRPPTPTEDEVLLFHPPAAMKHRTAPTEVDRWRGRLLCGEVHDENTWALGGAAGPAGLFGTAPAVGRFARAWLRGWRGVDEALAKPETVRLFTTRTGTPGSSRALGWDTMLPTSSCGHMMSPLAFGHTGFTGTSLWIDPEADVYCVLLTNRLHPTRDNERITAIRPAFHDAVMEALATPA
ncbi:MAG: beta-lactamase family protein [Acidobacteria bacterium]|nr:beta-lactamase family protein [Acidobacteriota bacterium]